MEKASAHSRLLCAQCVNRRQKTAAVWSALPSSPPPWPVLCHPSDTHPSISQTSPAWTLGRRQRRFPLPALQQTPCSPIGTSSPFDAERPLRRPPLLLAQGSLLRSFRCPCSSSSVALLPLPPLLRFLLTCPSPSPSQGTCSLSRPLRKISSLPCCDSWGSTSETKQKCLRQFCAFSFHLSRHLTNHNKDSFIDASFLYTLRSTIWL